MEGIFDPDVTLEESDLGEDLQLLYPESSPVQTRAQLQCARASGAMSRSPSPSESCSSSSRSPSLRIPSMSSARFSSPSAQVSPNPPPTSALFSFTSASTAIAKSLNAPQLASTSYHQLAVSSSASTPTTLQLPRAPLRLLPGSPIAELSSESNAHIIERFAQSYGELRAEVSMLRAQLRAVPNATGQLEERVRRLEIASQNPSPHLTLNSSSNRSAPPIEESLFQSNAAHRHPLQHLISGGDDEMDV
ncbi:hypothetical protein DFH06DRAFT_1190420, partial [Mycena polygramma]